MQIKYRKFRVESKFDIEKRVNEELAGWNITKIVSLEIKHYEEFIGITLIGEIDEHSEDTDR